MIALDRDPGCTTCRPCFAATSQVTPTGATVDTLAAAEARR